MWVRERDAIDYVFISAVTLLAYIHFPLRPEMFELLRWAADLVSTWISESPEAVVAGFLVFFALVGGAFALGVVRHAST